MASVEESCKTALELCDMVKVAVLKRDKIFKTDKDADSYIERLTNVVTKVKTFKMTAGSKKLLKVNRVLARLYTARASLWVVSYQMAPDVVIKQPPNDLTKATCALSDCAEAMFLSPHFIDTYMIKYQVYTLLCNEVFAVQELKKALCYAVDQRSEMESSIRKMVTNMYSQYLIKGKWRLCSTSGSQPSARSFTAHVQVGKLLYVYGGQHGKQVFSSVFFGDLFSFNLETREWSCLHTGSGRNTPTPCSGALLCYYNGSLYLHGGSNDYTVLDQLFTFNLQSRSWSPLKVKGRLKRHDHGGCIHKDKMYIFGGFRGKGGETNEVNFLDIKAKNWKRVSFPASHDQPDPRYEFAFWHNESQGTLSVFSGNPGTCEDDCMATKPFASRYLLWSLDLESNVWRSSDIRQQQGIHPLPVMEGGACTNEASLRDSGAGDGNCEVYFFGGYSDRERCFHVCHTTESLCCICYLYFNDLVVLKSNKWYLVESSGHVPRERAGGILVEWLGLVYTLFGYSTLSPDKNIALGLPIDFNDVHCCSIGDRSRINFFCSSTNCNKRENRANGLKFLQCARCKLMRYCSRDCQREHWRLEHKQVCQPCTAECGLSK